MKLVGILHRGGTGTSSQILKVRFEQDVLNVMQLEEGLKRGWGNAKKILMALY